MHYATTGRFEPEHCLGLTLFDVKPRHAPSVVVFFAVSFRAKDNKKKIIEQEIISRGLTTLNCQTLLGKQNITAKDVTIVSQTNEIVTLVIN